MGAMHEWIELIAQGVEVLAVAVMVLFVVVGTLRWLMHTRRGIESGFERYRVVVGKSLLIGLELLVAADIVRTVTLELTLMNLANLAGLVLIRTVLGWTLTLEIEGRWPWQSRTGVAQEAARQADASVR